VNAIVTLSDEYPGDDAWQKFLATFLPVWDRWQDKQIYTASLGDAEIAAVLTAAMGQDSIAWFTRACGALDGKSPTEILDHEANGIRIIRSLLMRMPF
jgi:hypothetical protein